MTPHYDRALEDICQGTIRWQVWGRLGWREVRRRYRRTTLGPFWSTMSLAIMIGTMGVIWARLFHTNIQTYLPFVCAGVVAWTLLSTIINEGCTTFTAGHSLITTMGFPYLELSWAVVWRNIIVFFHNIVVFIVVAALFRVEVDWNTLLIVPGLVLVAINGVWIGTLLGMACTRFRDVNQLVASLMQMAMLATPVFWSRDLLKGREALVKVVDYNVFYHFIEVLRAPLLGQAPTMANWIAVLASTVIGWAILLVLYARFRRRIAYWL